jgi:HSP20 family protein
MFALKPWTKRMPALLPRTETPFAWMPEEFATLFNRFFTNWPVPETSEWPYAWGLTTEEKEKEVVVRVELPGFEPEEVKVELLAERLTVEAEHKEPAEKAEEKTERAYAHVKRVLTLPPGVEPEKAEAVYRNGVLEVHLPRKPEAMGRRVEVKT